MLQAPPAGRPRIYAQFQLKIWPLVALKSGWYDDDSLTLEIEAGTRTPRTPSPKITSMGSVTAMGQEIGILPSDQVHGKRSQVLV